MTNHSFLIALGVGAALIAFWFAVRFPDRAPENLQRLLVHVAVVLAAGWLAPSVTAPLISSGFPTTMTAWLPLPRASQIQSDMQFRGSERAPWQHARSGAKAA